MKRGELRLTIDTTPIWLSPHSDHKGQNSPARKIQGKGGRD